MYFLILQNYPSVEQNLLIFSPFAYCLFLDSPSGQLCLKFLEKWLFDACWKWSNPHSRDLEKPPPYSKAKALIWDARLVFLNPSFSVTLGSKERDENFFQVEASSKLSCF